MLPSGSFYSTAWRFLDRLFYLLRMTLSSDARGLETSFFAFFVAYFATAGFALVGYWSTYAFVVVGFLFTAAFLAVPRPLAFILVGCKGVYSLISIDTSFTSSIGAGFSGFRSILEL